MRGTENFFSKETDLYLPVKEHLESGGYTVKGEVKSCDIVARKNDETIIIELKLSFNLELLLQIADRQKKFPAVYAAVPLPADYFKSAKWKRIKNILRRLEAGLIFVSKTGRVQTVFGPSRFDLKKSRSLNRKKAEAVISEFNARISDLNTGGSVKSKLITAYRETCVNIAEYLKKNKSAAPKDLKILGIPPVKAASILSKNYYGWFDHPQKGVYTLSRKGSKEFKKYLVRK